MKSCANCKNSPLNNSKLVGKAFEKTACFLCVMEDQKKNGKGGNSIESCGDVEFNEALHGHIPPVTKGSVGDALMRRMVKMKLEMWDLVSSGQLDAIDCRIVEMMLVNLQPSIREVARKIKTPEITVRRKWRRIKSLLSKEYVK